MTIQSRIAAIERECSNCWSVSGITDWERQRLREWKTRSSLSPKQEQILKQIEDKAFGRRDGRDH